MAKSYKKRLTRTGEFRDYMSSYDETGIVIRAPKDRLIEKWVYFLEIFNFRFTFASIDQIKEAKAYFERKTHPSNRDFRPNEHFWNPWYCRLPKGFMKATRKKQITKELTKMLQKWDTK